MSVLRHLSRHASAMLLILAVGCQGRGTPAVSTTSPGLAELPSTARPALQLSHYQFDPQSQLESRILRPTKDLLADAPFPQDPAFTFSDHVLTQGEREVLRRVLASLPAKYTSVLMSALIGFGFVDGWPTGAWTAQIHDDSERQYALIVASPDVLHETLSEWLTRKERTAFRPVDGYEIDLTATPDTDALLYVLLHETSHLIDFRMHFTPPNDPTSTEPPTAYTSGVWANPYTPVPAYDFAGRAGLTFYFRPDQRIPASQAVSIYQGLAKTPFCSLYASRVASEDFAELCTNFFLDKVMHSTVTVQVKRNGREIFSYEPVQSTLVRQRLPLIETLFQ